MARLFHFADNLDGARRQRDAERFGPMLTVLQARQGTVHTAASRSNWSHLAFRTASVRTFVRMRNSSAFALTASLARRSVHKIRHLVVRQGRMTASAKLARRLKAVRLQVAPVGRVAVHRDAVFVAEDHASAVKNAADRGIGLPSNFRFRAPYRRKNSGDLAGRDLMHRPVEQRTGIRRAKVALPLVFHLLVGRLRLGVGDNECGDLPERGDGPLGRLSRLPASMGSLPASITRRASAVL